MSTRQRKRRKTDLPLETDTKTLFHFFSKPNPTGSALGDASSKETKLSDTDSIKDESRQIDAESFSTVSVGTKIDLTPSRTPVDDGSMICDSELMEFNVIFAEPTDSCTPTKEEQNDVDPFEGLDFRDDEFPDEEFLDCELEFSHEGSDDNEDDINDNNQNVKQELPDTGVDEGPSCPFCTFSFKGLSENLITLHANNCLDNISGTLPQKPLPWTSRPPQLQPEGISATPTAFSKIMANNMEDKAWKAAAITENLRGIRAAVRPCPFYKIMPEMPGFAVDAFRYGRIDGIRGYFLSHFHSDHYGGMTANWSHGPIYCSSITASLVLQQIRVDPEYVVKLPMHQVINIEGVDVTLIDANHCPGSVLFLFEKKMGKRTFRILHCGDFRASPGHIVHPAIRGKFLDVVYLDTTYLNPKYTFPCQEDVITACAQKCQLLSNGDTTQTESVLGAMANWIKTPFTADKPQGRLLVVVGTYSIGKERIVVGIAKALGAKIYASSGKRRLCACLEDDELMSLITDDPKEGQVHMTNLGEIRAETLQSYLNDHKPHFTRVVGFRPTGWTYSPPTSRFTDSPTIQTIINSWKTTFSHQQLTPQRGSSSTAICFGAPYSEHSSFRDLTCFCCALDIGRIIPTVNVHTANSREKMKAWIEKWRTYKKKDGKLIVDEGQTRW